MVSRARMAVLLGAAALGACHIGIVSRELEYALGADVDVHHVYGTCRVPGDPAQGPLRPGRSENFFRAERPGRVRLRCSKEPLAIDVRPVARLAIVSYALSGPDGEDHTSAPGTATTVRRHASLWFVPKAFDDRGRELLIGETQVDWSASGAVERMGGPGCQHGRCPRANAFYTRASSVGPGAVVLRFGGTMAVARFKVTE